ncbi:MAG: hypothetical protein NTW96_10415 [Planctomycetia bacterium]|nr:hypothetical protein [Planctomycetia bacterium]
MSEHRSFIRKIAYLAAIACLLPVLFWLGQPSTGGAEGEPGLPGGRLAQLRTAEDLDQAQLGKIDPASETIKLATLGLRGVAANVLWTKANNYKMKKDWTNLSATLNQITKLQPNFVGVWQFQAWNLSYNCSAEFDDYRERYHWVIKGIDFLKEGISYNEFEPKLVRDVGKFISQKIGRADEHEQFRRLFREDDDFNASIPKDNRDNWYVGKQWYLKAEKLVDTHDDILSVGTSPLLFRSEAPMCQMNYADALEKDGVFGEKAKTQWKRAGKEWEDYGKLDIPTSEGRAIRLGELKRLDDQLKGLNGQLDKFVPGAREKLLNTKAAMLTDPQREAIATPLRARTAEQHQLAAVADELTRVTPDEVARQATGANRAKANQLLETIHDQMETIRLTKSYQGIVNFDYWRLRADVEQTDGMLDARKLVFEADKAYAEGNLPVAHDKFERGAVAWAGVLARFPELMSDRSTIDDIDDLVKHFATALDQRDELFPENFALAAFINFQVHANDKLYSIERFQEKVEKAVAAGDYQTARKHYEETLGNWQLIINDIPSLEQNSDPASVREILAAIDRYAKVLGQLKVPFPDNFVLQQFVWTQIEHDPNTRAARAAIVQGGLLANQKKLDDARAAFDQGLSLWRKVFDQYPSLIADKNIAEEVTAAISRYQELLKQQDRKLPENFILQDVLDRNTKK